jgi:hypothetical protein
VTVRFEQADSVQVNAIGGHAYAAINRAIERLRAALEPGVAERFETSSTNDENDEGLSSQ